jgi:hypothetical protein
MSQPSARLGRFTVKIFGNERDTKTCLGASLVSEREKLHQFIRERVLEGFLNDPRPGFYQNMAKTLEGFPAAEWSFAIVCKAIHEMVSCEI